MMSEDCGEQQFEQGGRGGQQLGWVVLPRVQPFIGPASVELWKRSCVQGLKGMKHSQSSRDG